MAKRSKGQPRSERQKHRSLGQGEIEGSFGREKGRNIFKTRTEALAAKHASGITIPAGSPIEDVELVLAGDRDTIGKYQREKLTLADHVYDMAANTKYRTRKIDSTAVDKDCFTHTDYIGTGTSTYYASLRNNMRRAEKIVLEDDFVKQVVQVSTPEGRVDLKQIRNVLALARNPFNRTWIEWNCRAMLEERKKLGSLPEVTSDSPVRIGALCVSSSDDGSEFYIEEFIQSPDRAVDPTMFTFGLNTEEPIKIPRLRRQQNGVRLDLNSMYNRTTSLLGDLGHALDWEPVNQISVDMNELIYALMFYQSTVIDWDIDTDVREAAGAIKFIATALALINSAKIQYNVMSIPSGRRLTGGKSIPYMEHRTVKIQVPAGKKDVTKYLNSVLKSEGARKRAHKVRGFWRTLYQGTSSERKVWVKQHVRGDASLGWVNQDHIVTT